MDFAEKLQRLRKARGLSQEQLAEKIGVSRQAVSKWESAQAVPDVDKFVLLSELFGVTTDYLLKETPGEPEAMQFTAEPSGHIAAREKAKPDALLFVPAATALNGTGLLAALVLWQLFGLREELGLLASAVGAVLMLMGCACFATGQLLSDEATRPRARRLFWAFNGGLLCYLPLVHLFNRVSLGREYPFVSYRNAPLPVGVWVSDDPGQVYLWPRWLFWGFFAALCVGFLVIGLRRVKSAREAET